MLDNLEVRSGSWFDLGAAKAGSLGLPLLIGMGPFAFGFKDQLSPFEAHPNSTAILVVGLSQIGAPFRGGTLVPMPQVLFVKATNAVGVTHLSFFLPPTAPPDLSLYFQYWISDPPATSGFAGTRRGLGGWTSVERFGFNPARPAVPGLAASGPESLHSKGPPR